MERKHRMRRHPLRSREILPVSGPIVTGWAGIGEDAYTAVESYPQRSRSLDLSWSGDFTPVTFTAGVGVVRGQGLGLLLPLSHWEWTWHGVCE